jgi:hypothetical protein
MRANKCLVSLWWIDAQCGKIAWSQQALRQALSASGAELFRSRTTAIWQPDINIRREEN